MKIKPKPLTKLEKYFRNKYVLIRRRGYKLIVCVEVGNQGFTLEGEHTRAEATYFRNMLGKALSRVSGPLSEPANPSKDGG